MLSLENIKSRFQTKDILALLIISGLAPLFFYKLGNTSLTSFDEAWYADIARTVSLGGSPYLTLWNGKPFYDHPPAGFWLTALSFKALGVNEFAARFAQGLSGLFTLYFVYLLGKKLFNRPVGLISAIALSSSNWFLFRARSGNLDAFLTLFFVTTIYFAIQFSTKRRYLIPFAVSASFLLLTKTLVPLTIIPALTLIFWRSKIKPKDLSMAIIIFLSISAPWFVLNYINNPGFLQKMLNTGLPGVSGTTSYSENIILMKRYIHNGIGIWFWPSVGSLILSSFYLKKKYMILIVFSASFFLPFIFSNKGHIWQLIPLHPFMILSFFAVAYGALYRILKTPALAAVIIFVIGVYFSSTQLRRNWYEFIDRQAYKSDIQILGELAKNYKEPFIIDGDYFPEAIFYSGKVVRKISNSELKGIFEEKFKFILITKKSRLDSEQISQEKYEIIWEDRDKLLIRKI